MKRCIGICFLCVLSVAVKAGGDDEFAVAKIPAALLENANVVIRSESRRYEINANNRAVYFRKVAYTILNEQGDQWGTFAAYYDKLSSIESFEGSLYDASGKKLKSLKKGDVKDVSSSSENSFLDANRVKWHSFFYKVYPYTVEYEVVKYYKGTMFLPKWNPQEENVMSVQQSQMQVITPASNPLRYKMFNYSGEPRITDDKSNKIYSWEIRDVAGRAPEYASPEWYKRSTSVFMATEKFFLEEYQGSNASWKDFGKFVYDLKKDRDVLPDDVKQKVHQLTDGLTDPSQKISKLYEYLQQNTRYISIQLGVGGWQPFDAKYVGTKKYGDCKALSNFMYALLKEAGIRSVYTVVNNGADEEYLLTDLPCSQFNHAILFVPNGKDTTWLECTSQTTAAGYLGEGTDNRLALAIDENGGTLVRTPKYGLKENLEIRNITATIFENGYLEAMIITQYHAIQQDRIHAIINGLSKDKLMEFLKEDIELATYDVRSFHYDEKKGAIPVVEEKLDLVADHYATVTGKRFFVIPNLITRSNLRPKTEEKRTADILVGTDFTDIDTAEIRIPAGYTPESVPPEVGIESKFGKYSATVKVNSEKIIYYRKFENYSGKFPPTDYDAFVKFYEAIYKADRNKVVLVKNQ